MASFPTVFWIMRDGFGDMVETIWKYDRNSNLRTKFEHYSNCKSDCAQIFRNFIDSFSHKIALLLLIFAILIMLFDIIFIIWNSHLRRNENLALIKESNCQSEAPI